MNGFTVAKALDNDIERILEIYGYARDFMKKSGNPTQWRNGYPQRELIMRDIENECLYVVKKDDVIHGVFFFKSGEDPTYRVIEDGSWLSQDEYGVIHRVAGDGCEKGLFGAVFEYCTSIMPHLRIDTHADNKVMQHVVEKYGFKKCGTIYVEDGSSRIAYELC